MNSIMDILNIPLGYVMRYCYLFTHNYGVSILLFTVVMTAVLTPLQISQKKNSIKQLKLRPQEDYIRKLYKNDKDKQQKEVMELYQKENFNPMSGCLPLLLQLPIIFALYNVIRNPLTYILRLGDTVKTLADKAVAAGFDTVMAGKSVNEIVLHRVVVENPHLADGLPKTAAGLDIIELFKGLNFSFLGLDLSQQPSLKQPSWLWLIPVLAGAAALASSLYTQKTMPQSEEQQASMKGMTYTMPLISVFFAFSLPSGVGLYWIFNSLMNVVREFILNKIYKPMEVYEQAKAEASISNNQRKKAKKQALKAATEKQEADEAAEKAEIAKNTKPASGGQKKGLVLPEGKKVSYRFEDDPAVIEQIKAHNAAVDRANGVIPAEETAEDAE